jgi:hypothetical protein
VITRRDIRDVPQIFTRIRKNSTVGRDYIAFMKKLKQRLTYVPRMRRQYKRWIRYGLSPRIALRRAREDA